MTNRHKYINHKVTRRDFYYSKYWNRNRECELLSCLIQQRHRRLVRMKIYEHTHSDNPGSQFSDYHCYTTAGNDIQLFTGGNHYGYPSGYTTTQGIFYNMKEDQSGGGGAPNPSSLQCATIINIFTGGDIENYYSELSNIRVEDGFANFFK